MAKRNYFLQIFFAEGADALRYNHSADSNTDSLLFFDQTLEECKRIINFHKNDVEFIHALIDGKIADT